MAINLHNDIDFLTSFFHFPFFFFFSARSFSNSCIFGLFIFQSCFLKLLFPKILSYFFLGRLPVPDRNGFDLLSSGFSSSSSLFSYSSSSTSAKSLSYSSSSLYSSPSLWLSFFLSQEQQVWSRISLFLGKRSNLNHLRCWAYIRCCPQSHSRPKQEPSPFKPENIMVYSSISFQETNRLIENGRERVLYT